MGEFFTGGRNSGQVKAVPLARWGRIKIIAVDYRMSPEFIFPAASEDMETVYRYALKSYQPKNIGIFCSGGDSAQITSLLNGHTAGRAQAASGRAA